MIAAPDETVAETDVGDRPSDTEEHAPSAKRAPPAPYKFSVPDRIRYGKRFWRLPVQLQHDAFWSELVGPAGRPIGGGAVASVVPTLSAHTYRAPDDAPWTRWNYLSHRRIAALSGVSVKTVSTVIRLLKDRALLEQRTVSVEAFVGGTRQEYRLASYFYPDAGEEWARFPATLLYYGLWAALPTPATRHLYLVIASTDPVLDEPSFFEDEPPLTMEKIDALAGIRAASASSISKLASISGLSRSVTASSLRILIKPVLRARNNSLLPYVNSGEGRYGGRWFAPNREAWQRPISPVKLNERGGIKQIRGVLWP